MVYVAAYGLQSMVTLHICQPICRLKEGCALHQILPRALQRLSEGNPASRKAQELAFVFDSLGFDLSDLLINRGLQEEDWIKNLAELDGPEDPDKELSYDEINQKRKQLTFQAFRQTGFRERIQILDHLVAPNVQAMYQLFKRTGNLGKLCYLPADAGEDKKELMSQHFGCQVDSRHM